MIANRSQPMGGVATSRDGIPLAFEVHGAGTPSLVFVHGWSCDRGYWSGQVGLLVARYQTVAVDLAGHGESASGLDHGRLSGWTSGPRRACSSGSRRCCWTSWRGRPHRLGKVHGDKAYDHRRCRAYLRHRGIRPGIARRMIESSTRLGRHRWTIERTGPGWAASGGCASAMSETPDVSMLWRCWPVR
jgi:hypothetical protein